MNIKKEGVTRPLNRVIVAHYWNQSHLTAEGVDKFYRRLGYLRTPYHFIVDADGKVTEGRPVQWPGGLDDSQSKAKNIDAVVVGVLLDPDKQYRYTKEQNGATGDLTKVLCKVFGIPESDIEVFGV